jgi:tRNA (adenine37-N6)-methyltransferase
VSDERELTLKPIGYLRCKKRVKFSALHQPDEEENECNVLELVEDVRMQCGLQDLAGFSRIWLIWWFHRNDAWRPMVLPPRGPAKRRGVFATRSPHRPCPIGMTPVKLLSIEGRNVRLGPCDLVDGTPVFDIKPYIPDYDSFPEESQGWLDEVQQWVKSDAVYRLIWQSKAVIQRDWLREKWQVDFSQRAEEILSRDPSVHRTRRIRRRENGVYEMGCGSWRLIFQLQDKVVEVMHLEPGYPLARLMNETLAPWIADRNAQVDYFTVWPEYV